MLSVPSAGRPRRTIKGRLLLAVHRCAVGLVRCALRFRPSEPYPNARRVTFLLAHAYGVGGTTRTVLNLAAVLSDRYETEVLSVIRSREVPRFDHAGVAVTPLDDRTQPSSRVLALLARIPSVLILPTDRPMRRRSTLATDVHLVRALWHMPAGVLIGTRPSLTVLAAAARRPGTITVAQEHMNLASHRPDMRAELLRTYRRVDAAVTLTERDREAFAGQLPNDRVPLVAIPNAVPPMPAAQVTPRRRTIVAIGRLTHQKGFDLLLTAFAVAARNHPTWKLRIIGGGPLRAELEQQSNELDLAHQVHFAGPASNVPDELARASVFVLSSRAEGFPVALIEAMAAGLAVVAFDCQTGPAEIIRNRHDGILVRANDVAGLAAALEELMCDVELRRTLGSASQASARRFDRETIGRSWTRLLDELLASSGR